MVYDQSSAFGVDTAHLAEYDYVRLAYGLDSNLSKASSTVIDEPWLGLCGGLWAEHAMIAAFPLGKGRRQMGRYRTFAAIRLDAYGIV